MKFYLGTHEPGWLRTAGVPLMVSRNRLERFKTFKPATVDWVLDSGGFTELQHHGGWRTTAASYAADIRRYESQLGPADWCAPQDWMCEPAIIQGLSFKGGSFVGTGLTVAEHQARTVGNYLDLKALDVNVIPVLQGFTQAEYQTCVDLYTKAGVDLAALPTVGLGSVCRRENTDEIGQICTALHGQGIRLHGFGCKTGAIARYGSLLASADSMAWSLGGRQRGTCTHLKSRCSNHLHWALDWRTQILNPTRKSQP